MGSEPSTGSSPACTPGARCQAVPRAARRWGRADAGCASAAAVVVGHGALWVAVCRIHEGVHSGWGELARANASQLWGWPL
jgi:hypothetical protein